MSLRPTKLPGGGNDTGRLFNVHPVVMITAFGVVMAEALQTWRQPLLPSLVRCGWLSAHDVQYRRRGKRQMRQACAECRSQRKMLHAALQTLAILLIWVGATFSYLSHTLKEPTTIPNFYSASAGCLSRCTSQHAAGMKGLTFALHVRRYTQLARHIHNHISHGTGLTVKAYLRLCSEPCAHSVVLRYAACRSIWSGCRS